MSKKIKKGRLDQYGAERFGRVIFATVRSATERVKAVTRLDAIEMMLVNS